MPYISNRVINLSQKTYRPGDILPDSEMKGFSIQGLKDMLALEWIIKKSDSPSSPSITIPLPAEPQPIEEQIASSPKDEAIKSATVAKAEETFFSHADVSGTPTAIVYETKSSDPLPATPQRQPFTGNKKKKQK